MRIHAISDLHLENEARLIKDHRAPPHTDVVVIAGDVHPGTMGITWAAERFAGLPVIYVPGNHEYYGKRGFIKHLERMRAKAADLGGNVHVADRDRFIIGGVRFLCATLWTGYTLGNGGDVEANMVSARRLMNDYKSITSDINYSWTVGPGMLLAHHARSVAWLAQEMSDTFDGPTVVVSHHAPSPRSIPANIMRSDADSESNHCYATDLEWLMRQGNPGLWIHGHIHASHDYMVANTRVFSNPRGCVSSRILKGSERLRENPLFDPTLLLDV